MMKSDVYTITILLIHTGVEALAGLESRGIHIFAV